MNYANAVERTFRGDSVRNLEEIRIQRLLNAGFGLVGEAGEVSEHIKKHIFQGATFTNEKFVDELGDVLYYLQILANTVGVSLEEIQRQNIEKLQLRYPNGFEVRGSEVRVDIVQLELDLRLKNAP